jgi:PKD repeat protein
MIRTLKIFLLLFVLMLSMQVSAQLNEWTWVHGDNLPNQNGNYGVQGVSSPTNKPPASYEGCEWTDHNGNFWFYGGQHLAGNFYSDLWKYNPSTNEWVWVHGPGGALNMPAVYGTQGVPSPANLPGGRGWAPSSWVDNNNNLWMFAGCDQGTADMNNLWMYNISTNEWTWMKGANFSGSPGNPGIIGVPSITNEPSARHESTCSWIDGSGDLWMFGGYGFGQADDLWRYTISTNMWTWMKGDPFASNPPVYGTQGIPDPLNTPGARNSYSRWADKFGNLWLFGGIYYASGTFNDVWKYTIATNEWTWMKGPSVVDDMGNYGSLCIEDSLSNPSAHLENRSCWTDSCGNFWTFGGVTSTGSYPGKNDLWKFNPVTNNWTWVSGSSGVNDPGNYGSIGISSPTNIPPARMGSFAWQDVNGNLWMGFGQSPSNNNYRNDLWRFVPDPSCSGCSMIPVALFSAPNHICPGTCTDFINLSQGATSYIWTFTGASPNLSTDENPTNICYNTPGTFPVSLIVTNSVSSDTLTLNNYITVYPYPPPQGIQQSGDTLFANAGAVAYQWYYDGNIIPGATEYFYVAPQGGNYNVVVTDANDCEVEAAIFDVVAEIEFPVGSGQLAIFPNPVTESLSIIGYPPSLLTSGSAGLSGTTVDISIYNLLGEKVFSEVDRDPGPDGYWDVNCELFPSGMYWLELSNDKHMERIKFIKQ